MDPTGRFAVTLAMKVQLGGVKGVRKAFTAKTISKSVMERESRNKKSWRNDIHDFFFNERK